MVAYSFQRQFVLPIRLGLVSGPPQPGAKRHTIRADGLKRHARPGEEVQLYTAQRTKQCELIGRARCTDAQPIEIHFRKNHWGSLDWVRIGGRKGKKIDGLDGLHNFSRSDGFVAWDSLRRFWRENHPKVDDFLGRIIFWEPL